MTGKKPVIDALSACLRLERTASEFTHDQEHAFERKGWGRLERWFDRRHDDCSRKRHRLVKRLYELDQVPNPASDNYQVSFDASGAFNEFLDLENAALQAYADGIEVCMGAKDFETMRVFQKNTKVTTGLITKAEAKLSQIAEIGLEGFLSMQD